MDTYTLMLDDYGDGAYVDDAERDELLAHGWTIESRAEILAQFDQGARTADETAALVSAEIIGWAGIALANAFGRPVQPHTFDAFGVIVDAIGDWDGNGWTEPTEDDDACERVHWELEHAESIASMIGLIVDWNADAGTVTILRPIDDADAV